MNLSSIKFTIVIGILGFLAGVYMIIANVFLSKEYSIIAIIAGLISPLYILFLKNSSKK